MGAEENTEMNKKPLQLHIPEPKCRPGDQVDFSDLKIPPAGKLSKPEVDVPAGAIRDHAYDLVRVLDDKGKAVGPWNPKLSADTLREGLRHMLLTREFDERMIKQ